MNPMAFFKERGFSGTRSNTRARFSGEPPSLSILRSQGSTLRYQGSCRAQGSRSEPGLSLDRRVKQRPCQSSKTMETRLLRDLEITKIPAIYSAYGIFRIFGPHSGSVQAPMIRRMVLNFLQCFRVAMFTKLQFFSSILLF